MLRFLLVLTFVCLVNCSYFPKQIGKVTVSKPAFTSFIPSNGTNYHLAVSTFNAAPFSSDYVFYFPNFNTQSSKPQQLDNTNLVWPNEVTYTNTSIFNNAKVDPYGGILVGAGFLVPSKTKGGVFYYPFASSDRSTIANNPPIEISNAPSTVTWFYHRVRYVDVSGDGIKDLLTCRTHKPIIGTTLTEMVAFVFDTKSGAFVENVIGNHSCDVFFEVADIDNDGRIEIVAAGFFISELNIIYSDEKSNSFVNGNAKSKTIDNNAGFLFDVKIYNLDLKSNLELLITNHQGNTAAIKGSLFYYSLSGNVRNGTWTRNTISDNYPVLKSGVDSAAPGGAKIFFPNLKETNKRPYIILAGDGSEYAYLYEPSETDPLSYTQIWNQRFNGYTVGEIAVADINNDGYSEFVIPAYEANLLSLYTFAP